MVKLQKPIPKTIKKIGPELKKVQTKKIKGDTVAKKVKKTLVALEKNEVREVKQKNGAQNKKLKVLEKVIENAQNKKKKGQEKKFSNGRVKITPVLPEAQSMQVVPKSKKSSTKNPEKGTASLKKTALEELPKTENKSLLRGKPVVAKVKQPVKKAVGKNNSSLEKVSKTDGKVFSKKALVSKCQQPAKRPLSEKTGVLEELKKITSETKKPTQNAGKRSLSDAVENPGQKKSVSKVQKKSSYATKKELIRESKVKKNESEDKEAFPTEQNENVNSERSKSTTYGRDNFDEDKFKHIVSLENIKKIGKALKVLVEKEVSEKKTAIFSDYSYFLNIAYFKIPNCPKRMVKLNLKHALVNPEADDVVIIVPDLQRGAKVDYEPTIQHYEDILRENGVENIKVLPFNQLRNEYSSFEAKRKLSNTYDHFLCDGRIVSHVVGFCGKNFQKPRTTIHAVRLNNPKTFKSEIEHALKRTSYRQLQKGDLISIPVGNHLFTTNQLAENIQIVIDQLKTILPGSYANIRNIHIKIDIKGTSSLPLYANLAAVPADVPNIIGPREQRMLKLKKQANDILSKFSLSKTGNLVKLNKAQVKRKQQLREARTALTSTENVDENASELDPPLNKKSKKRVEPQNAEHDSEDKVSEGSVDESEDDSEENDE